ncbi:MAG: phosphoribosylamine--glycine ligase [Elusimicrobia bacterium]|nr:MAG: phosphoribosylamine--glycine ligase [Elusimicrobiota bacterium]KAF0158009.1 MAG: phosphoribosylamine--glycine ligase [Elusimicrobiota bacterium]
MAVNILIIGSGGREHALAWKLKRSPLAGRIYAAPGSEGMRACARPVPMGALEFDKIADFCAGGDIGLCVIGPEEPLAKGLADHLAAKGVKVFGPRRQAAMLEASKQLAKEFMRRNYIPTAGFQSHYDPASAKEAVRATKKWPLVVKADGLAAGKGVRVCPDEASALSAVEDFMEKRIFGSSGARVVLEEFLEGREASVMALCDGKDFVMLPVARDHKRLRDGDEGPNTGGMGAVAPVDLDAETLEKVRVDILGRFVEGLKKEKIPYCGVIFAGLMLSKDGPKALEFNVRFGDPETQTVLPLLKSDLLAHMLACAEGRLAGERPELHAGACATVVLAAAGYPDSPATGAEIRGLDRVPAGAEVFHAGTAADGGRLKVSGGRVLGVSARGADLAGALRLAYRAAAAISFDGAQYRRDIGKEN